MRWLRQWGPAIVWAVAIWVFSTQTFSSPATSRFLLPLLRLLLPGASPETLEFLHAAVRKAAHFVEYFILSLLVLRGIRGARTGWRLSWGVSTLVIIGCYAALDELHQAFAPGRTSSTFDVLIDSSGATVAQLLAWGKARWLARGQANKAVSPRQEGGL